MKQICADLKAEYDVLDDIVSKLDNAGWATKTYCDDWTIQEEIAHIAFYDGTATLSATDPEAFAAHKKAMMSGDPAWVGKMERLKTMDPQKLLGEWREARAAELEAFAGHDPKDRVPWYGPDMSVRSKATARLMETWAHGQDVVDVTDAVRTPTDRLKHVCHIGVITLGWAYTIRQKEVPSDPVHVALNSPSGESWTWGPEDAANSVAGNAEEFCLVVTQRRNPEDTGLTIRGDIAGQWMKIAQAFAGPPADIPAPGVRKNLA